MHAIIGFAVMALLNIHQLVLGAVNSSSQALNPQLTNTIPNAPGGPILYYNGSGPVPPYNMTSPIPAPISPINRYVLPWRVCNMLTEYVSTSMVEDYFFNEIVAIVNGTQFADNCTKCIASVELLHIAAITQPVSTVTDLLVRACNKYKFSIYAATCEQEFSGIGGLGPYWAQLFSKMSLATGDMQAFCSYNYDVCDPPPVIEIDESQYFSPKPASAMVAPEPSGKTFNVLHISDWHMDPRYDIGSEANCSQYLCCRPYATNTKLHTGSNNASVPASRFGYLYCDSPADLALGAFTSIDHIVGIPNITFSIFTGDIVSHDNDDQLSRAYVEYEEEVTYETFKAGQIFLWPGG